MVPEPLAVSIAHAGRMLSLSRTSIYRLLHERALQRCATGCRRTLITVESIENLIANGTAAAQAERR